MGTDQPSRRRTKGAGFFEQNAQHGQNRAGVELDEAEDFDEFESRQAIDPRMADARIEDEGPEIRARIRRLGHDVVAEEAPPVPDTPTAPSRSPQRR